MLIHLTTQQFSIYPQTILDELWPRGEGGIFGLCSDMTSSLYNAAFTCICGLRGKLCSQTDFWKCS